MLTLTPIQPYAGAPCGIAFSNRFPGPLCTCLAGYRFGLAHLAHLTVTLNLTLTPTRGIITWDGIQPSGTCTETRCTGGNAVAPENGRVSFTAGNRFGSKATFSCNEGFILRGDMVGMCMFVCLCIRVCEAYVRMHVSTYVCVDVYAYVCTRTWRCVYACVCACAFMCVCVHVDGFRKSCVTPKMRTRCGRHRLTLQRALVPLTPKS